MYERGALTMMCNGSFLRLNAATVIVSFIVTVTCLVDERRLITRRICTADYGEFLMPSFVARTRLSCVVRCSALRECQSLVYDPITGECWLNKFRLTCPSLVCPLTLIYSEYQQPEPTACVTSPVDPLLRLCDGSGPHEGRLEVNHEGFWGTVCDDMLFNVLWNSLNAKVVCSMFGYQYGTSNVGAFFGQGQGCIWLDDVQCAGTEASLFNCTRNPWAVHDCGHSEDVGVTCTNIVGR